MIRKAIYLSGVYLRNNHIFHCYKFLKASQYWSISEIKNYQFQMLKKFIKHASEQSPFYKNKFQQNGFNPDDLNSLHDLEKIPITSKAELLQNKDDIQIWNLPTKLIYSETSGSTGKPLVFYRDKEWDAWHNASVFRGLSWHNAHPWEKSGLFWGYNFSFRKRLKVKFFDYLQNQKRLFSYRDEEIKKFANRLRKMKYLEGYSSMIYEIAKQINRTERKKDFALKMIKGTSEKIVEKYQEEVRKAFGKKIISEYGAAEAGIIAFECPEGNMHINMETVIVEEIDNEIVLTNLVSNSFPIIRYRLGDYIELDTQTKCRCGREHHLIKEIKGRVGKVIYGKLNKYPSLTLYYVFKNLVTQYRIVLNYQAFQHERGSMKLNIEQKLKNGERSLFLKECIKYFGDDLTIEIADGSNLASHHKKKVDFISTIENSCN